MASLFKKKTVDGKLFCVKKLANLFLARRIASYVVPMLN